jgi:hypothetical protein
MERLMDLPMVEERRPLWFRRARVRRVSGTEEHLNI